MTRKKLKNCETFRSIQNIEQLYIYIDLKTNLVLDEKVVEQ